MSQEKTFEESIRALEGYAEKMTDKSIPLEEAIRCYQEGIKEYEACRKILEEAKQTIETIQVEEE